MLDINQNWRRLCRFLLVLFLLASRGAAAEEEIKWIPAEEHGDGPLPLSTRHREELLKLEQAIMSSPDPSATLQKVAASNEMDPSDLARMLQQNRESFGPPSSSRSPSSSVFALVYAKVASIVKQYPRLTVTTLVLLAILYYTFFVELPRSGIVLSSQRRSLWTKGPTTFFRPPRTYLDNRLYSTEFVEGSADDKTWKELEVKLTNDQDDGLTIQRRSRNWKRAMTYQMTVPLDDIFSVTDKVDPDDAEDILINQSETLVSSPEALVEWAPRLNAASTDDGETLLVVPGMGDWGRYGLLQLHLTYQSEDMVVLSTCEGAHWDGQLVVSVVVTDEAVRIRTSTIITTGRVPHWSLVEDVTRSVAKSIRLRSKQDLSRRRQSSRFAAAARKRSKERREDRSKKERLMEEMASDRRRRWQRKNPNSGSYRPSGDRMKSPNNAYTF